jgi:xanthine dehydrogenase molybdopterin-binding subunit B
LNHTNDTNELWIYLLFSGTLEAIAIAEHIIEHVAHEIEKDPLSVRMKNLNKKTPIDKLIQQVKEKSDYDSRKAAVEKFNLVSLMSGVLFDVSAHCESIY